MKSTVERLSPTRVRINVEVPFDELKPDFDRAYRKIAQQVRIPGFRPGKAPARILEARLGRGVVLDEVVNAAIPAKYSEAVTSARGGQPDRPPGHRGHRDRGRRPPRLHRRGRRPPGDHAPRRSTRIAVTVDDVEVDRRGRRRGARQPAGPVRHPDRRRAARRGRRLRAARPVGHRRRRGRRGGHHQRLLLPGGPGRADRRHRRGRPRAVGGRVDDLHLTSSSPASTRARTPRSPRPSPRSRSASCPTRTTSSPSWPASSTPSTS